MRFCHSGSSQGRFLPDLRASPCLVKWAYFRVFPHGSECATSASLFEMRAGTARVRRTPGDESSRWETVRCSSWGRGPRTVLRLHRGAVGDRRSCHDVRTRPVRRAGVASCGGSPWIRSAPTRRPGHHRSPRRLAGRLHHIGVGRTHARTRVLILVHDLNIRIIKATTGGLLRYLGHGGRDTAAKRIAEIGDNEGRSWPRRQLRGERCSDDACLTMPRSEPRRVPHCREHRRLLDRGASTFTRFVGRSGVSSVIEARPR